MVSLGAARSLSLLVIALLGVLGQVAVATPTGPDRGIFLPDLGEVSLVSEHWSYFYFAVREVMVLVAIMGVLATAVLQYRDEPAKGCLVLSPFAVLAYLALPAFLPADLGPVGALLVMAALFAVALGAWVDLQPEEHGRPAYYSALGVVLALVMYVGNMERAIAVPGLVIGTEAGLDQIRWGLELLAVLIAPAALTALPALKLAWNRSSRGFWWS